MTTIMYDNHAALKRAFCCDCARKMEHGCKHMDPMDCSLVKEQLFIMTDNSYKVQVGKFYLQPVK